MGETGRRVRHAGRLREEVVLPMKAHTRFCPFCEQPPQTLSLLVLVPLRRGRLTEVLSILTSIELVLQPKVVAAIAEVAESQFYYFSQSI